MVTLQLTGAGYFIVKIRDTSLSTGFNFSTRTNRSILIYMYRHRTTGRVMMCSLGLCLWLFTLSVSTLKHLECLCVRRLFVTSVFVQQVVCRQSDQRSLKRSGRNTTSLSPKTQRHLSSGIQTLRTCVKVLCKPGPVIEPEHQTAALSWSRHSHMIHAVEHPVQSPGHFLPVQPHVLQPLRSDHRVDCCHDRSDRDDIHWQHKHIYLFSKWEMKYKIILKMLYEMIPTIYLVWINFLENKICRSICVWLSSIADKSLIIPGPTRC